MRYSTLGLLLLATLILVSCNPPGQFCGNGFCEEGEDGTCTMDCGQQCEDTCVRQGARECVEGGYRTCVSRDGCLQWTNTVTCANGQSCVSGRCEAGACDACERGTARCAGNGVETCADADGDGCAEWNGRACPTGQTCSAGRCQSSCVSTCTIGSKRCGASGLETCGDYNSDGCAEWKLTPCPAGQACKDGACAVPACESVCVKDATRCEAGGLQRCVDTDADSCFEWKTESCGVGRTCREGACVSSCADACTAGASRCVGNGIEVCADHDQNGCTEWKAQLCPTGQSCREGTCVRATIELCAVGATRCSPESPLLQQVCERNATGDAIWSAAKACAQGQTCQAGSCKSCDSCTAGAKQCASSGLQTCARIDGCLKWNTTACPTGQTCSNGACVASCTNVCTAGASRCSPANAAQRQVCAVQANGCTDWGPATACALGQSCQSGSCQSCNQCSAQGAKQCSVDAVQTCEYDGTCLKWRSQSCPTGQTCRDNACAPKCTSVCAPGATQCSGASVQTCGDYNNDGCAEWSVAVACGAGKTCQGTACQSCNECTAGAKTCEGTQLKTCTQQGACLKWTMSTCPAGQACSVGVCKPACTNTCTSGASQCSGTAIQTCRDTNGDGCTEWSAPTTCPTGQACRNSACAPTCTNTCSSAGAKECSGNGYRTCISRDSCLQWTAVVVCPSGQACSDGVCKTTCTSQCTSGAKRCNANAVETCGDYNSDGCFEWQATQACSATQTCSGNACVASCTNACSPGSTRCAATDPKLKQTCVQQTNGCYGWGAAVACGNGQVCSDSVCQNPTCIASVGTCLQTPPAGYTRVQATCLTGECYALPRFPSTMEGFVAHIYRSVLDRNASAADAAWHAGNFAPASVSVEDMYRAFFFSPEYTGKQKSDAEFVRDVYQAVLFREPSQAEIDHQVNDMVAATKTREQKLRDFFGVEFKLYYDQMPFLATHSFTPSCAKVIELRNTGADVADALQTCLNDAGPNGVVELPAGKYHIGKQILFNHPGITLRTKGKTESMPRCSHEATHDCAELVVIPGTLAWAGTLRIVQPESKVDHIVLNGNKQNRLMSEEAKRCRSGEAGNVWGMNFVFDICTNCRITNSVSKNGLCGTALGTGMSKSITVHNNAVVFNGYSNYKDNFLWSDGITANEGSGSTITDNLLIDNTDIDLILGGCPNCVVRGNSIKHTDDIGGRAYAGFMLYQWPGHTSGNYTGTIVTENTVDCGAARNCGYGLLIGANPWVRSTPVFGGQVYNNNITNARDIGLLIDDAKSMVVRSNTVTPATAGPYTGKDGISRQYYPYAIGSGSRELSLANPDASAYTRKDYSGIPR